METHTNSRSSLAKHSWPSVTHGGGDGFRMLLSGDLGGEGTRQAPLRVVLLQGTQVLQELLGHRLQAGVAALGHGQDPLQGQGAPELGRRLGEDFRFQNHRLDKSQHMKTHLCVGI